MRNQAQYGKAFTLSYSPAGLPLLYWIPEKHKGDPEPTFDQVKLVVYLAERSSDLMVAGVECVSPDIKLGTELTTISVPAIRREVGFIADLAGKIEKSSAQISVTRGILQTMQTVRPSPADCGVFPF